MTPVISCCSSASRRCCCSSACWCRSPSACACRSRCCWRWSAAALGFAAAGAAARQRQRACSDSLQVAADSAGRVPLRLPAAVAVRRRPDRRRPAALRRHRAGAWCSRSSRCLLCMVAVGADAQRRDRHAARLVPAARRDRAPTDTAAVLGIFRDIGAPSRLHRHRRRREPVQRRGRHRLVRRAARSRHRPA